MSITLDDVEKFLIDIIKGDFADDPSAASMVVNGAIGLIPVVEQILDMRDVLRVCICCSEKGWNTLRSEDTVDISFAAFGCIPEVGTAFKEVFKPVYKMLNKNRKQILTGGLYGVAMEELLLSRGKGGAIKWIQSLKWAEHTQDAISKTQLAISKYIEMLEVISHNPWWASKDLVYFAKQNIVPAQNTKSIVAYIINQGSVMIQSFVCEMLDEHAAYVAAGIKLTTSSMGTSKRYSDAEIMAYVDRERRGWPNINDGNGVIQQEPSVIIRDTSIIIPKVELHYHYDNLEPMAGAAYRVTFQTGEVREGILDNKGYAAVLNPPNCDYVVLFSEDPAEYIIQPKVEDKAYLDKALQRKLVSDLQASHYSNGLKGWSKP
jgi:hypothetical protein